MYMCLAIGGPVAVDTRKSNHDCQSRGGGRRGGEGLMGSPGGSEHTYLAVPRISAKQNQCAALMVAVMHTCFSIFVPLIRA